MQTDLIKTNGKTQALDAAEQTVPQALNAALIENDFSKLSPENRAAYYRAYCESLGLNWLTRPLDVLKGQDGKHHLYPKKECGDQLARVHAITFETLYRESMDGLYIVGMKGVLPNGRVVEDEGIVPIKGLQGKDLANARKKAITQARRRVTLALVGLGWTNGDDAGEAVPFDTTMGRLPELEPATTAADHTADLYGDEPVIERGYTPEPETPPETPLDAEDGPTATEVEQEYVSPDEVRQAVELFCSTMGWAPSRIFVKLRPAHPEAKTLDDIPGAAVLAFLTQQQED